MLLPGPQCPDVSHGSLYGLPLLLTVSIRHTLPMWPLSGFSSHCWLCSIFLFIRGAG
ncbi:unnamed protein product [Staurois parvus]|uniref:Uncharacterized protein n=1 Tax=Staurois parvus TaxID=386267 RepID=A0ABN9CGN2_9NEOB|nr:unnamed protein product [Staurois parvus]